MPLICAKYYPYIKVCVNTYTTFYAAVRAFHTAAAGGASLPEWNTMKTQTISIP